MTTISDSKQLMLSCRKPLSFGAEGGIVVMAVFALVACGGSGPTGSTNAAGSDPVTSASTPSTSSAVTVGDASVSDREIYRDHGDGGVSTVDIFVGDGNDGGPLVVLLHGYGDSGPGRPEDDLGPLGEEIAELGSTVFYFGWQTERGYSADSADDLSCVGPFVAARAAEFGADPDNVVVVGHSMGAESGSMLAFSSFDLDPSPDCTETGQASRPTAFVGIGGAYGVVGGPLQDDPTRFQLRTAPDRTLREFGANEEVVPGLTAAQLYQLDGYRAMPPRDELDIVLVVGGQDQYSVTDGEVTARFAETLRAEGVAVEVVTVDGANHDDIVDPFTDNGQATLRILTDVLSNTR